MSNSQGSRSDSLRPSVHRDLFVVAAVTLLTFALSSAFELNEWVEKFTVPREAYQVDELPLTFLAMSLALAWFSWRRSKQVVEQVALRLGSEEHFRMLFMENLAGNLLASMEGRIKLANPAAAQMLGFDGADELKERQLDEFYVDGAQWRAQRETLLSGGKVELPLLQLRRCDGAAIQVVA
jgi:PAS domain-containing protein